MHTVVSTNQCGPHITLVSSGSSSPVGFALLAGCSSKYLLSTVQSLHRCTLPIPSAAHIHAPSFSALYAGSKVVSAAHRTVCLKYRTQCSTWCVKPVRFVAIPTRTTSRQCIWCSIDGKNVRLRGPSAVKPTAPPVGYCAPHSSSASNEKCGAGLLSASPTEGSLSGSWEGKSAPTYARHGDSGISYEVRRRMSGGRRTVSARRGHEPVEKMDDDAEEGDIDGRHEGEGIGQQSDD